MPRAVENASGPSSHNLGTDPSEVFKIFAFGEQEVNDSKGGSEGFPHKKKRIFNTLRSIVSYSTPALHHFIGNFRKWHHIQILFYKSTIVHIFKPESQRILQNENSLPNCGQF